MGLFKKGDSERMEGKEKTAKAKKPFYKRWWFIAIVLLGIIGALGSDGEDAEDTEISKNQEQEVEQESDQEVAAQNADKMSAQDEEIEAKPEVDIEGYLDVEFVDDKAVVTINTNAIDGSIFETFIMDGEFNSVSDFIVIENGIGVGEFDVNADWDIGYLAASSMMRFNLEEHPQPDNVKDLYGENGENIIGELAVENNLGGNNVNLEILSIAYPDEASVKAAQDELFIEALKEIVESSNGVIVNIQPHFTDGDWSSVAVIVSDAWYNSAEYEKERFAEQVGETVKSIVLNTGRVSSDEYVSVYFYDTYQEELASPKVFGGYKIKR